MADSASVDPGDVFDVEVRIESSEELRGVSLSAAFDPTLFEMLSLEQGAYFSDWASGHGASVAVQPVGDIDNVAGTLGETGIFLISGGTHGPSGSGVVWVCHMRAKAGVSGTGAISLAGVSVADRLARVITDVDLTDTSVEVQFMGAYIPLVVLARSASAG